MSSYLAECIYLCSGFLFAHLSSNYGGQVPLDPTLHYPAILQRLPTHNLVCARVRLAFTCSHGLDGSRESHSMCFRCYASLYSPYHHQRHVLCGLSVFRWNFTDFREWLRVGALCRSICRVAVNVPSIHLHDTHFIVRYFVIFLYTRLSTILFFFVMSTLIFVADTLNLGVCLIVVCAVHSPRRSEWRNNIFT